MLTALADDEHPSSGSKSPFSGPQGHLHTCSAHKFLQAHTHMHKYLKLRERLECTHTPYPEHKPSAQHEKKPVPCFIGQLPA